MNKKIVIISIASVLALALTWWFIFRFELPIKEGVITEKYYQAPSLFYMEKSDSVYRSESYTTTDSDGKVVTRTRQVFDHYEYAVYEIYDGEDFIINIESSSKKIEGKILDRDVYITESRYNNVSINDFYKTHKENNDSFQDRNNYSKRVTPWRIFRHDMSQYNKKSY